MLFRIMTGIAAASALFAGTAALAQDESTNRVAAKTDWSVFVEDDPTECWGVSSPKSSANTRELCRASWPISSRPGPAVPKSFCMAVRTAWSIGCRG